jgi:prepilin-type processing-associated H-X9-DG protein
LLVVIGIIGLLIGILLPAVQKVRESANSAKCKNNSHQIGLSLLNYHDVNGRFPPGVSSDSSGNPYPFMSWLTRLLPFIEGSALWDAAVQAFKQQSFFESPPHHPVLSHVLSVFVCPSDSRCSKAFDFGNMRVAGTSYLGIEGLDQRTKGGLLYLDSRTGISDVLDGTSNTFIVGERPPSADGSYGWWYAGWGQSKDGSGDSVLGAHELVMDERFSDCPAGEISFRAGRLSDRCDFLHFWSVHSGGGHFLFADGSVRFLSYSANSILPALASRAGGETFEIP